MFENVEKNIFSNTLFIPHKIEMYPNIYSQHLYKITFKK